MLSSLNTASQVAYGTTLTIPINCTPCRTLASRMFRASFAFKCGSESLDRDDTNQLEHAISAVFIGLLCGRQLIRSHARPRSSVDRAPDS